MSTIIAASPFGTRRLGRTGREIGRLGLGGATLAGIFQRVPDEDARATVAAALDAGIRYFDTAPQYGYGRSEHLMGDGLRFRREGTMLSTKVGRLLRSAASDADRDYPHNWVDPFPFEQVYDYSYGAIRRSFEDSLQRLGLPGVDILYVHDIGVMTHGAGKNAEYWRQLSEGGGYRALTELKAKGLIGAIGLGVNEWQVLMDAFELGDWDVFLLAGRYTLLEQTSLTPFLSTCLERGASVVCGGPFNGGALMGTGMWNYDRAPAEIVAKVHALEAICNEFGVPIGAAALQFPLAHEAICSVLPGPKSPDELAGILGWWDTAIPDPFWNALADRGLVSPGTPLPNGRAA
jgi:D-threo-aldose 1-dehydrogenase